MSSTVSKCTLIVVVTQHDYEWRDCMETKTVKTLLLMEHNYYNLRLQVKRATAYYIGEYAIHPMVEIKLVNHFSTISNTNM